MARRTPVGKFAIRGVRLPDDLALLASWMNDPEVDRFWKLAGPLERTEEHLRSQVDADGAPFGTSTPCVGLLDGVPMSYWELYRADLDPVLAPRYPACAQDAGVHLLLGPAGSRGRGYAPHLLNAVTRHLLARDPLCVRVVAEPDVGNVRSVAAFRRAGFRHAGTLHLPEKTAALLVRPRRAESDPQERAAPHHPLSTRLETR